MHRNIWRGDKADAYCNKAYRDATHSNKPDTEIAERHFKVSLDFAFMVVKLNGCGKKGDVNNKCQLCCNDR